MPPLQIYDKVVLDKLYKDVSPSIVSVNTYDRDNYTVDFTTGFIIYSDRKRTLICVHKSAVKKGKQLYVHFSDGVTEKAEVFLRRMSSGHVVLSANSTGGRARRAVQFSERAATREDIFTITEVEGGYVGFNMVTGTVCIPDCKVRDLTGTVVPGNKDTFAMSSPVISFPPNKKEKSQVIGAAVFDLTDGLVIGTIKYLDKGCYDLKFTAQSYCWLSELEDLLHKKDRKLFIRKGKSKKARLAPSGGKASPGPSEVKVSPGSSGLKKRKLNKGVKSDGHSSKSSRTSPS